MNKRINYIDIAKRISIILVVMSHLVPNDFFHNYLNMLNIPVFLIAYGMVAKAEQVSVTAKKRFQSIYLPYVLWGLIFSGFSFKRIALILYGTNQSLIKAGSNGMLWFLPVMFIGSLIVSVVTSIFKENKRNFIISGVVFIGLFIVVSSVFNKYLQYENYGVPLALDIVFYGTCFILAGNIWAIHFDNIYKKLGNNLLRTIVGLAGLAISGLCVFLKENPDIGYLQIATLNVGLLPLYFILGTTSAFGVILLSRLIENVPVISKILIWLGQNSMVIFIMHRTIVYPLKAVSLERGYIVLLPIVLIIMLYSSACAWVVNKFCPYLAGKQKLIK